MENIRDDATTLKLLGNGTLPSNPGRPAASLLETFPNKFPNRLYIVRLGFPEYTSLCPVTGQPDFGTIIIEYIPDALCVESKSFKLYMFAWRSEKTFMETVTNVILEDMISALQPWWCMVKGLFVPRGGTQIQVFAEEYKNSDCEIRKRAENMANLWKQASLHDVGCKMRE